MKNLFLLYLATQLSIIVSAQIEGPRSGTNFTTSPIIGSNKNWSNPNNIGVSDNTYSDFGNLSATIGAFTDYLVVTGFGFSIPANVIVTGIVVEVERSDPNGRTSDHSVRIVKANTIGSTERSGGASYGLTDSYQLYGNAGDLWGEGWTPSDINNPGFGVAIAAKRSVGSGNTAGRIDHIRITVFYDFSTTLPVRLTEFSATPINNEVLLNWRTCEESNMQHYIVERSANGKDFIPIHTVNSLNNNFETRYSITDIRPVIGIAFYRIKMVGRAGDIKHSAVIPVTITTTGNMDLYPTIVSNGQIVHMRNPQREQMTIRLFNPIGSLIGTIRTSDVSFPCPSLPGISGIIIYQVLGCEGRVIGSGRLLINH